MIVANNFQEATDAVTKINESRDKVLREIEKSLNITDHWVVCVIAIGKQTSIDSSSDELKARETAERTRLSADSVYSINQALN
jgi:hypothetical protein